MTNVFDNVMEFHEAFELPIGDKPDLNNVDGKGRALRVALLREEFEEYLDAEDNNDIVEIADALGDIIYIACGTAIAYGIPLELVFNEIQRSNMAKLVDGKVLRREDGKIMKPEGWQPPDIKAILEWQ
jgi:predicted HAD superfamily Cof-like phosphohydrolase